MKNKLLLIWLVCLVAFAGPSLRAENIPDLFLHDGLLLNGEGKSIIDPCESGFYDYRCDQRDLESNPSRAEAFFQDVKPANPGERVEYDFDTAPKLNEPGDRNTQLPKLLCYEGSMWYRKQFDFAGTAKGQRWTEEFQADLYQQTLPMLDKIDGLVGCTPWILVDFRSPRRPLAGMPDGFNRKGLISSEGVKKEAFTVLQEYCRKRVRPLEH